MVRIYRESFRFFLASLPVLIVYAAIIEVMLWVLQPKTESTVSFVALTIVAYMIHRHFLFDETLSFGKPKSIPGAPAFKFGWFALLSGGLLLVSLGIGLGLAVGTFDRPSPAAMLLIFLLIYLVTLSFFGLALPASVARDGSYRLSQGLRSGFQTMWRLVLGPGVIGFALLTATALSGNALVSLGVTEDSNLMLAYYIALRTMGFLTTIIAVAVLCEMYRKTRPDPHLGKGPAAPDQMPA
jgi:hypothetical protein